MEHVGCIEAIVAKFVVYNLVGRKICNPAGIFPYHELGGEQQRGFRQLAAVIAILGVTYRTDGNYHIHVGISSGQQFHCFRKIVYTLVYREFALREQSLRTFCAVVHYLACFVQYIYMICSECHQCHARRSLAPCHGMQDACRIIHHAVRINHGIKLLFDKPLAYVVGKARTNKEHVFKRLNLKVGLVYLNFCPELHIISSFPLQS